MIALNHAYWKSKELVDRLRACLEETDDFQLIAFLSVVIMLLTLKARGYL